MGVETLRLLIDLLEVKEKKNVAIKFQKYEEGATLRDQERILERMVYRELLGYCDGNWETFNYKAYDFYDVIKLDFKNISSFFIKHSL